MQIGGNKAGNERNATRALLLAGAAAILSGCVSAADPAMFAPQGFAPDAAATVDLSVEQPTEMAMVDGNATEAAPGIPMPVPSPASADAASRMPAVAQGELASGQPVVMADTAVDALNRGITQSQSAQPIANLYSASPVQPTIVTPEDVASQPQQAPAAAASADMTSMSPDSGLTETQPQVQELAVVAPPKKKSIFARMFAPQKTSTRIAPEGTKKRLVVAKSAPVTVASAGGNSLPGVKMTTMFGEESEADTGDADSGQIQLASAAGLARLAPNGLHLQTDKVEVDCFKPQLVRTLKSIERHYGRPVVVTSGYRSPKHNRRIGGASGSRHTSCEAADIQIEGVSKWQLAKYLRSMPERGGVGTYCHTESVHIDVGNMRDWNWRCRRRK
ncbi:YcbK family protein [Hoeflea sp. AS60]|uniref:YcbK family protein n=1 Tax=Hoeflea sp. AS60 TaxID=3135780 RepID=UPI003174A74B